MRKITYPLSLRSMVSAVLWCVSAVCTQAADYDQFSLKVGESTFTYTVTSEADKTVSLSKVEPLPTILEIPDRVTRPMQGGDSNGSGVYTVTYVSRWTYGQNLQVRKLVLPATIKDASSGCFAGWIGLDSVVCHSTYAFNGYYNLFSASPEKFNSNYDRYMSIYHTARLCVPFGSYRSYARTNPWAMFTHISEGLGEHSLLQPVFDRDGGEYDEKFALTLTNPNNVGEIYYYTYSQTDGLSGPQRYNGPIEIGHSCTVTAYVTDGTHCSDALSKTYTVSGMTLYVAGMEVNSRNQWDILGDKGSVAFDSRSARLIMDNANINCMDYKAQTAIEAWDGDLTIELRGDNVITTGYQGIDYGYGRGRGTGGRLRIEGDKTGTATLTINCDGKWTQAINLYLANMDIANCRVIVRQATTGIYSKAGGKGDGTLGIDMGGTLDITSTQSAVTGIHTLSLGKDMAILRPAGARFVAASPYDDKEKEKESYEGNIVVADKVQTDVLIGPRQQEPALPTITESTSVTFADAQTGGGAAGASLSNTIINEVYYNLPDDNGNGYDQATGSIVIATATTEQQMEQVVGQTVGSETVAGQFTGIVVAVPQGEGCITADYQTTGAACLGVQTGNGAPTTIQSQERATATIFYQATGDNTYIYLYNRQSASQPQQAMRQTAEPTATANTVRLWKIGIHPGVTTAIGLPATDNYQQAQPLYNLNGHRVVGHPQPGIYIRNHKKVIIR